MKLFNLAKLSTREDLQFRCKIIMCMHIDEQWLKTLVNIEFIVRKETTRST